MKDLIYKVGDEVTYTPSSNYLLLGLFPAKFSGKKAKVIKASRDKFGWPRYTLDFGHDTLEFVSNDSINCSYEDLYGDSDYNDIPTFEWQFDQHDKTSD